MTKSIRNALGAAVAVVIALLAALFTGMLDDVLRRVGVEIAGHPPAETAPATEVAAVQPAPAQPDPAKALEQAAVAERVVPIFDLVRVEPSGDAVIAGQGLPKGKVDILSGEGVIASGTANDAGEWAIVLKDPLKAGAHDLKIRVTLPTGEVVASEQSVAVSVPEGGKGEVLVVLNEPGSASTVLQVPGLEEAQKRLAATGTPPAAPAAEPAAAGTEVAAVAPAAVEPAAADQPPAAPETPPAAAPAASAPATAAPATESATTAVAATPVPGTDAGGSSTAVAPATAGGATTVTPDAPAAQPADVAAAAAPPAGDTIAPAGDASTAPAASPVPAESPVPAGDAAAPAGEAAAAAPAAGSPQPAADGSAAAGAASSAAGAGAAASGTAPAEGAAAPAADAAAPAGAAPAAGAAPVTVEAVEVENGERFYAAGSAAPGSTIRVYVDDKPVADTKTMQSGRWLLESDLALPPGSHKVRVDQIGPDGAVVARSEVPYDLAEDQPAAPTGASGSGSASAGSGTAGAATAQSQTLIIRRGDNLWMIAKRLYGRGVRYSTIYQANTDQIRNPDLIYPGQVFVIPEGDQAWEPLKP